MHIIAAVMVTLAAFALGILLCLTIALFKGDAAGFHVAGRWRHRKRP